MLSLIGCLVNINWLSFLTILGVNGLSLFIVFCKGVGFITVVTSNCVTDVDCLR